MLSQPSFVEYNVIHLGTPPLLTDVPYEPVELRGTAPLGVALPLFAKLRGIVPEVTYRADENRNAVLIFSSLEDDTLLRPHDVQESPVLWTERELKKLDQRTNIKPEEAIRIDLSAMWGLGNTQPQEKKFYEQVYAMSPCVERATLSGECPMLPALVAANWFLPFAQSVLYEKTRLK